MSWTLIAVWLLASPLATIVTGAFLAAGNRGEPDQRS
jgi:hypothetical protein